MLLLIVGAYVGYRTKAENDHRRQHFVAITAIPTLGKRVYLAGVVPDPPGEMIAWIRDPRAMDTKTAMPNTGLTPKDARDIAAFLYSLP